MKRVAVQRVLSVLSLFAPAAAGGALAFLASCNDPEHQAKVDALGPEADGVEPGPLHRPGQPCLTCHGGGGPAEAQFAVAGTLFATKGSKEPMPGATVAIMDATQDADGGTPRNVTSNAAGNFYVRSASWTPSFPLHDISVTIDGLAAPTPMHTRVGREGSCAGCHFGDPSPQSPGALYLVEEPEDLPK